MFEVILPHIVSKDEDDVRFLGRFLFLRYRGIIACRGQSH
jgi:hypothetical protein